MTTDEPAPGDEVAPPALVADPNEALAAGWEPHLPPDDTLQRHALLANVARMVHDAESGGFPWSDDGDLALAVTMAGSAFANWAFALRPVTDGPGVADRLRRFFDGGFALLFSPWPTPDLTPHGLVRVGHPPLMVRPPGGSAPAPPAELEILEVTDADGIAWFEEALIEGYPAEGLEDRTPGCLLRPGMLDATPRGRCRRFVGLVDGRPVATSAAFAFAGAVEVDYVATLPSRRGRGYGAALTWAAVMVEPAGPAMLIASDDGRPVYERMGFRAIERWTVWALPAR